MEGLATASDVPRPWEPLRPLRLGKLGFHGQSPPGWRQCNARRTIPLDAGRLTVTQSLRVQTVLWCGEVVSEDSAELSPKPSA